MNYSEFKNWRNSLSVNMQDLTFAHPNDIFVYTKFNLNKPFNFKSEQVLFAEDISQAIGYLRHIFLYDILNDNVDDLEFDFNRPLNDAQMNCILLLNYWFKMGKISSDVELKEFCNSFNRDFNNKGDLEYEIQVLNGIEEVREFLIKKYSTCKNFDIITFIKICDKDLFSGNRLKKFLDEFLDN